MAQSTWAASTNNWSASPYIWYNTTYQDTITLGSSFHSRTLPVSWSYNESTWAAETRTWDYTAPDLTYFTIGKQGNITLGTTTDSTGTGGFAFVGNAILSHSVGTSLDNNTIYVDNITLGSNASFASVGNQLFIDSVTLSTESDMPLPGMSEGWDDTTTTWSSDTSSWGYMPNVIMSPTANMTQTILSELNEEDAVKLASALLSLQSGTEASATILMSSAISLDNTQNIKFNINFEENITITGVNNISSINNFLWDDVTEDTTTTWTKVADPDA